MITDPRRIATDIAGIPDASVDLVYLDPPFNSNANYNVLFKEIVGAVSVSEMCAFER
jgi:site-specific DNA-methyltransferase (adenine-specific)